jgi:hypothetical protein
MIDRINGNGSIRIVLGYWVSAIYFAISLGCSIWLFHCYDKMECCISVNPLVSGFLSINVFSSCCLYALARWRVLD